MKLPSFMLRIPAEDIIENVIDIFERSNKIQWALLSPTWRKMHKITTAIVDYLNNNEEVVGDGR